MVDAPVQAPPRTIPNPERARAIGFTPGCRAKYLSSYCSVASISSGEMYDRGVQIRNFWSDVNVTRSNSPLRPRTHCENETPSSSGGFGRNSQIATITVQKTATLRIADFGTRKEKKRWSDRIFVPQSTIRFPQFFFIR